MCTKKHRYKCPHVARNAAKLLAMQMGEKPMKVYQCRECGLWCLTRSRRGGKRNARSNNHSTPDTT